MRLSEAMMLGSTTCKMVPGDWNSCAIGCAGNAIGIPSQPVDIFRVKFLLSEWPWLGDHIPWVGTSSMRAYGMVTLRFDEMVCTGEMTFEQLVDYVRSIEPECGECCRFDCTCVQKMDESQPQHAYTEV